MKYKKLNTDGDNLTTDEIAAIKEVYEYLDNYSDDILTGLRENKDLIIFNERYEFLICDKEAVPGWEYVCNNEYLNKKLHRRIADNPQAFAVFVEDNWIASMSTKNTGNKHITNAVPMFFPPQLLIIDDEHYKATIIHEMIHAYQANNKRERFMKIQTLHNVCKNYYGNKKFNELIIKEACYLKQAIMAEQYEDILAYTKKFIEMREKRRTACKMSKAEIQNEADMKWLEGLARYAEYKASPKSNSPVVKSFLNNDQKAKTKSDERYYTLGMVQALVLDKLQEGWKREIFKDNFCMVRIYILIYAIELYRRLILSYKILNYAVTFYSFEYIKKLLLRPNESPDSCLHSLTRAMWNVHLNYIYRYRRNNSLYAFSFPI